MMFAHFPAHARFLAVATGILALSGCHPRGAVFEDAGLYGAPDADSLRHAEARYNGTSASQTVEFSEAERRRYSRVELMIQAHFAGVQVFPASGGYTIHVRGTSFSNHEPLLIVDGLVRVWSWIGYINPIDVTRIEIVKDATASVYGPRGENGVIIITTRRR